MVATVLGFDQRDFRTVLNFARMFIRDRYLGSRLGSIWAIANPLILMAMYTFVFGFVFKARLPGADTRLSYSIWLIAGYGPWLAMSEGLVSSANSIFSNSGIVKNLAFKTECLPLAAALVGLVPLLVSLTFLFGLLAFDGNSPTWHAILIIPAVLLIFGLVASLGLGLAALVVFYRDLGVALPSILNMILFASPIFYPLSAVPRLAVAISEWNPFFIVTQWIRLPLISHEVPPLSGLCWLLVFIGALGWFNLAAFRRVKGQLHSAI